MKPSASASPNRRTDDQLKEIVEAVQDKTKDFNPDADPDSEFTTTENMNWLTMCNRYMSGADRVKFYSGLLASLLFGGSLPAFCLLFGDMIDGVGQTGADSSGFDSL